MSNMMMMMTTMTMTMMMNVDETAINGEDFVDRDKYEERI